MNIVEGRKAPDFTLPDKDGKPVSLSDFTGHDVIVYFYPADDTPGCTKEACGFRDAWKELKARGAVVLGVSPDGAESHRKFSAKFKFPFLLLSDPDKRVMTDWGAWGEKVLYGRRFVGVIRSTVWVGPDGVVRKRWARVPSAEKHPASVLKQLASAAASRT
ncbi:MAG: peroxiredoxin [Planctomycetes bacterium]|nr:peroxiredoxin [Planctomycetota bacterium]